MSEKINGPPEALTAPRADREHVACGRKRPCSRTVTIEHTLSSSGLHIPEKPSNGLTPDSRGFRKDPPVVR